MHKDCCNGVSIHPSKSILATSSGQHHFPNDIWVDDETKIKIECDDETVEKNTSTNGEIHNGKVLNQNETIFENSLEFWWIGRIVNA